MIQKRRVLVMVVVALALAGLTTVLQAGGGRTAVGPTSVEIRGGDPDSIREFLIRTLTSVSASGDSVIAYIGTLPDDLPFDLPLPEDAHLVGSITHSAFSTSEIIFDTGLAPKDLVTFFADNLPSEEWQVRTDLPGVQGGFVQQEIGIANFCYKTADDVIGMTLNSTAQDENTTDAHLYIANPGDPYMCDNSEYNMAGDAYARLPELRTPEGVTILPSGGGGGGGGGYGLQSASMSVQLETERPVADVLADYNTQLEAASWTNVITEAATGFAWSGWTFTDESNTIWSGTLTLTVNPAVENQYNASITITETREKAG